MLIEKTRLEICGDKLRFCNRSNGQTIVGYTPMNQEIRNNLWFLDNLPDYSLDAAHDALAVLAGAIERVAKVMSLRRGH